ncbi:MAG TPA: ferritin-like protein [Candidatus Limnocylindria bacterium]|nr:ferritin-like protein [Candidatus Limnocylindria bacterium]
MLQIDRSTVDTVDGASSADDLTALIQEAVRLEFSTIPPYLTAMLSLKPGQNREIWGTIHDIVVDEMLHMAIVCNLLNALGQRPTIAYPGFVLTYPSSLPLGIGGRLEVGLRRFSLDVVEHVFMEIEEPENPLVFRGRRMVDEEPPSFSTIGEFYRTLAGKLLELGDGAFSGDPARQVVAPRWFPAERLFAITDAATAARALTLIIEEGEGTSIAPVDPDGDIAHYYRFKSIVRGQRLVRDLTTAAGYSFTGPPYRFDATGVWPLTPNQRLADLDEHTEAWRRANQFRVTFTRLLMALQRVFDGEPGHLDAAMGVMFELKLAGQVLASLPVVVSGQPIDQNAGPVFEYAIVNR